MSQARKASRRALRAFGRPRGAPSGDVAVCVLMRAQQLAEPTALSAVARDVVLDIWSGRRRVPARVAAAPGAVLVAPCFSVGAQGAS